MMANNTTQESDLNTIFKINFEVDDALNTAHSQQNSADDDNNRRDNKESPPPIVEEIDDTESGRKEVFLPYKHRTWTKSCKPHPGSIVESASLAAIENSLCEYDVEDSLPPGAVSEGKLSSLQLEGIILAAQRHRMKLPSGERAGFFIGDAAGVGKGRQIAGVITDMYSRGKKKHIWFSVSTDLIIDARRDLADIGCYIKVIDGCQEIDRETKVFGLSDSYKDGVIFSTYSTLTSSVAAGGLFNITKSTRLQQLVDWCGKDFDGCLVFDECHKAKNFIPGKETSSSKVALAVCSIQQQLPGARVLYCSATGVTDVKNMAFMERMGLWGTASAFKSYEHFLETVTKKGLGIAEMLAMDMKRDGLYVSRMLSYSDAEFHNVECNLTQSQITAYNMSAHIWSEVWRAIAIAASRCNVDFSKIRMFYWSAHQRFFQQLCMSIKVDAIVRLSQEALAAGQCVIIGLQNTGEASTEGRKARDGRISGFVSTCREILLSYIHTHFPTMIVKEDPSGVRQDIKLDEWSDKSKEMLLSYATKLELEANALDSLIDKLGGPKNVAEMTGRKGRICRAHSNVGPHYEQRMPADCSDQSINVQERDSFMGGKKLVAIISDAASTGISLHADKSCKNQRQRVHITMQLPWSADKAVQQLGRSHRSNQASGPVYNLLTTELGGERRFAASVARRLQSLGALTKGDRRAASVADLSQFNFDTIYGRTALHMMYNCILKGELPKGVTLKKVTNGRFDIAELTKHMQCAIESMGLMTKNEINKRLPMKDSDARDVKKFLNRILGLQVVLQNIIFTFFTCCLEETINMAKKEGKFNEGFVDLHGNSITREGEAIPVFQNLCEGCRQITLTIDRGMTWDEAVQRLEALGNNSPMSGFYKTRHPMNNKYYYLLITPKENSDHYFKIARPNTGINMQELDKGDLHSRYEKIGIELAEQHWKRMYDDSLTTCNHGKSCNHRDFCQVGKRRYQVNVICGSLLRILPLLEETLLKNAQRFGLSKYECNVKVVRVCLDNGERLIGFQYPSILMKLTEKAANAMATEIKDSLCSADRSSMEVIPPVVPRMLKKASTEPTTIKTFFTTIKTRETESPHSKLEQLKPMTLDDDEDIICVMETPRSTKRPGSQVCLDKFFKKACIEKKNA